MTIYLTARAKRGHIYGGGMGLSACGKGVLGNSIYRAVQVSDDAPDEVFCKKCLSVIRAA